ncbi:MAG: hypothetical protein M3384_13240, partial [Acidobacteriota bacterium]|nr:hypothetical protein [Acidobacteriota bacterium]
MHPLVEKLEKRLLPEFEKIAEKIRREIPNVSVRVYSSEVGSLTQYQGHGFYIDCLLTADYADNGNVGLDVSLGYLTTTPRICAAVGWNHPSGHSEIGFPENRSERFPDEGVTASDAVLEDLYKNLPRLYGALFRALK